jgi:hypothetical protein
MRCLPAGPTSTALQGDISKSGANGMPLAAAKTRLCSFSGSRGAGCAAGAGLGPGVGAFATADGAAGVGARPAGSGSGCCAAPAPLGCCWPLPAPRTPLDAGAAPPAEPGGPREVLGRFGRDPSSLHATLNGFSILLPPHMAAEAASATQYHARQQSMHPSQYQNDCFP